MKKNDLRDALSAIDRRYIEESDDLKAVSADFRKAKNRKIRVVSSLLCLAVVGAGLFGADKAGLFKQDPHTEHSPLRLPAERAELSCQRKGKACFRTIPPPCCAAGRTISASLIP